MWNEVVEVSVEWSGRDGCGRGEWGDNEVVEGNEVVEMDVEWGVRGEWGDIEVVEGNEVVEMDVEWGGRGEMWNEVTVTMRWMWNGC